MQPPPTPDPQRSPPQRHGMQAQQRVAEHMVRRLGPWRYLQFLLVGVLAGWLAAHFGGLQTVHAVLAGAAAGIGYYLLERARGTV